MNDREFLELAAKAAGIDIGPEDFTDELGRKYEPALGLWVRIGSSEYGHWWNPRDDDGDALRLAVNLSIAILPGCRAQIEYPYGPIFGEDPTTKGAHRIAVLRAAAEIGKAM